jgi:hypothetical protein
MKQQKLTVDDIKELTRELVNQAPTIEKKMAILRALIQALNERAHEH